jgi:hypothetical protein
MNSAAAIVQEEDSQLCRVCNRQKPLSAFYANIDTCKSCVRTRNGAKIRSIERSSHESNPEAQPSLDPDRHPAYELLWVIGRLAALDEIAERRWEVLCERKYTSKRRMHRKAITEGAGLATGQATVTGAGQLKEASK